MRNQLTNDEGPSRADVNFSMEFIHLYLILSVLH